MSYRILLLYFHQDISKNKIKWTSFSSIINIFIKHNKTVELVPINKQDNILNTLNKKIKDNIKYSTLFFLFYSEQNNFDVNLQNIINIKNSISNNYLLYLLDENIFGFSIDKCKFEEFLKINQHFISNNKNDLELLFEETYENIETSYIYNIDNSHSKTIKLNHIEYIIKKALKEYKHSKNKNDFFNIVLNFCSSSILNIHNFYSTNILLDLCLKILNTNLNKIKLLHFKKFNYKYISNSNNSIDSINNIFKNKIINNNIIDYEQYSLDKIELNINNILNNQYIFDYIIILNNCFDHKKYIFPILEYMTNKIFSDNNIDCITFIDSSTKNIIIPINSINNFNKSNNYGKIVTLKNHIQSYNPNYYNLHKNNIDSIMSKKYYEIEDTEYLSQDDESEITDIKPFYVENVNMKNYEERGIVTKITDRYLNSCDIIILKNIKKIYQKEIGLFEINI
jgi:hypothetical protein